MSLHGIVRARKADAFNRVSGSPTSHPEWPPAMPARPAVPQGTLSNDENELPERFALIVEHLNLTHARRRLCAVSPPEIDLAECLTVERRLYAIDPAVDRAGGKSRNPRVKIQTAAASAPL